MKVTIFRRSGMPLELADIDLYKSEWARIYDNAARLCKKDMLRLQSKMAKVHNLLQVKYKMIGEVPLMDSVEAYQDIIKKYGPILVTTKLDSNELVYVVEDAPFEQR